MESLKHEEMVKDYHDTLEQIKQADPTIEGVKVEIVPNYVDQRVELRIGQGKLFLTPAQAFDLGAELRKAARRFPQELQGKLDSWKGKKRAK